MRPRRISSAEALARSARAVMIVHGEPDTVIPVENASQRFAGASGPRELYVIPDSGHGGFPQTQPEEYQRRVVGFFERYLFQMEPAPP